MQMNEIQFTVNGRNMAVTGNPVLTSGSFGGDRCVFTFDSQWNGFTKSIVFSTAEIEEFTDFITDNKYVIPDEVMRKAGLLKIGVTGIGATGTVLSTNFLGIKIITGANETETIPLALADYVKINEGGDED